MTMTEHRQAIDKAMRSVTEAQTTAGASRWKPQYHVAPPAYWTNDPNGFVYYRGEYHLFYQHNPYGPEWGSIHWGHAVSADLARWRHLPIALAPGEAYDRDGVFSGSAIEKDGKLWLMYTGNQWTGSNYDTDLKQFQCLAISEDGGVTFEKIACNPVIGEAPEGDIHPFHFRDPKVWQHEGVYYCVLGSRTKEHAGQIVLYRSDDLTDWEFIGVAAGGDRKLGFMWECPDLFALGSYDVLVFSPQGMEPERYLYHNLHQAGYLLGKLDYAAGKYEHGDFHLLDYGFDFYAPQTLLDGQGRRIMIAWMAMWESEMPEKQQQWAGAMTIPREMRMRDGKIVCTPVPELRKLRQDEVSFTDVAVQGELELEGISGDCAELEVRMDAQSASRFGLKIRCDESGQEETVLTYDKTEGMLTLDRSRSGAGPGGVRQAPAALADGELHLRLFIDRSSVEIFIQDGEKTMTARIYPGEGSTGIRFFSNARMVLKNVTCWRLAQGVDPYYGTGG